MRYQAYEDPIITNYRFDDNGNKQTVPIDLEEHTIVNGMVALIELPDPTFNMVVKTGGAILTQERDPETKLNGSNYYVDYEHGYVFFNSSINGASVQISYGGMGVTYYPASRVWLEVDDSQQVIKTLGNISQDIESVKDLVHRIQASTDNLIEMQKTIQAERGKIEELGRQIERQKNSGEETLNKFNDPKIKTAIANAKETITKASSVEATLTSLNTKANQASSVLKGLIDQYPSLQSNINALNSAADQRAVTLDSKVKTAIKTNEAMEALRVKVESLKGELESSVLNANQAVSKLHEIVAQADLSEYITQPKLNNALSPLETRLTNLENKVPDLIPLEEIRSTLTGGV